MSHLLSRLRKLAASAAIVGLFAVAASPVAGPLASAASPVSCVAAAQQLELDFTGRSSAVLSFRQQLSATAAKDLETAVNTGKISAADAAGWAKASKGPLGKNLTREEMDQAVEAAIKRLDQPDAGKYPKTLFPIEPTADVSALRKEVVALEKLEKEITPLRSELERIQQGKPPEMPPSPYASQFRERRIAIRKELEAAHPEETKGPRAKELNGMLEEKLAADPESISLKAKEKDWLEKHRTEVEGNIAKVEHDLPAARGKYDEATKPYFDQIPDAKTGRGFPYGFESREQFQKFSGDYSTGLKKALQEHFGAGADVHPHAEMEGSAVTGRSFAIKKGDMAQMSGAHSDFDVGVEVSDDVFNKIMAKIKEGSDKLSKTDPLVKALAPDLKVRGGTRSPALTFEDPDSPLGKVVKEIGLSDFLTSMQNESGRKVSVMFYRPGAIGTRGALMFPMN